MEDNNTIPPWQEDPVVVRYKSLAQSKRTGFFDVEEFQVILDHFLFHMDLEKASEALDKALAQHPGADGLLLRKADLKLLNGEPKETLRILSQLQMIYPTDTDVLSLKAEALNAIGQNDRAIHILEALSRDMEGFEKSNVEMRLAQLRYTHTGALSAIPHWHEVITIDPEMEMAYTELEECYVEADLLEESARYFRSLVDANPYNSQAWSSLGSCLRLDEQYESAVAAFEYALAIDEMDDTSKALMAYSLYQLDRYQESLDCYAQLHESFPDEATHLCCMAECLEQLGRLDAADKRYREALTQNPEYADARLGLAILRDLEGETHQALKHIETAVGLEPENPELWLVYAKLLSKSGDDKRSRLSFARALQLNPDDLETTLHFIDHLCDQDEEDMVLEKVQVALNELGDHPELYLRALRILHSVNKTEEYSTILELMLDKHPKALELLKDYYPLLLEDEHVLSLLKNY